MGFNYETNERDEVELFKTHYYKTSYDNLKKSFLEYCKLNNYEILDWNDDYFEGNVKNGNLMMTVKIIMQNPRETSIDFFVDCSAFFGAKKKVSLELVKIYDYLKKQFELKGLGLHA